MTREDNKRTFFLFKEKFVYFFLSLNILPIALWGSKTKKNSCKNRPILFLRNGYLFDIFPSCSQTLNKAIK